MSLKEKFNELVFQWRESASQEKSASMEILRDMVFRSFSGNSDPMAVTDLITGVFIDINQAFTEILGFSRDEVIGHTSNEIQIFADITDSNRYFRLLSKFKKISEFPLILRKKDGNKEEFLFSAEKVFMENGKYLLTTYTSANNRKSSTIGTKSDLIIEEIFDTISTYLALFSLSNDNRFLIKDLSIKVEVIERIRRADLVGKYIEETPLYNHYKLIELLNHLRITGEAHKLSVSPNGDSSEGFYMGFVLSNGDLVVTWEPGHLESITTDDVIRQRVMIEKSSDNLPEMVFELDLAGNITYANLAGLSYFGYQKEDISSGKNIIDIFPTEDLKKVRENLEKLKDQWTTSNNNYIARKKDGKHVPVNTRTFGLFHNEELVGYRGVITDISKLTKYEDQIVREKAFLENLIASSPEAIVITDIPGKITLINKEFTNLFGFTPEEAIDKYIDDLIVPDDLIDEGILVDELALKNNKETRQTIRKDKLGNKIDVSLIASTIIINGVTVALVGIYRDNRTEKKNQMIQEILFNISTSALKQFDIKDLYPTIVSELGKIWDTNNFYIALYDKESNTISLPFFSDEKDSFNEVPAKGTITSWVIRNNRSVLLTETDLIKMEEAGEVDMVGTPCKVWMGVPLRVDDKIIGVIVLQDYNSEDKFSNEDLNVLDFIANQIATAIQRRTMLDNLISARQKAEEAAQSKQTFMSTMSHEIRTPLNEVIGIANLLMQGNPREDQMELIKTLRFSANHLISLVNDVLDYSKMESGKIVFERTQFDFTDFLEEINRSYTFRAKEKKLEFTVIRDPKLPDIVFGDPIRLNQILSNLLSNALKFTLKGGIEVNVRELMRTGNQSNIEFRITDTGIGIQNEKLNDIFDSFTQASPDTTRRFGGTGLGLAICKKLVELQGGKISADSELNVGSSFTFNLILTVSEEKIMGKATKSGDSQKDLTGKKILVAEDNKINFFVVNKFLSGWGMIVTHVENGLLAVERVKEEEFDMILMDLHMPVMDGIEATRIIRGSENPQIKDIPIVALTAAIMSENYDKIDDLKINEYVLKPFKPQDLYDKILRHIR